MNKLLLRQVAKAIKKHPRQFAMGAYFDSELDNLAPAGGCGTAACIAGWAIHLSKGKDTLRETADLPHGGETAMELLDINMEQRNRLFYLVNWPEDILGEYHKAKSAKRMAEIAVARINRFIRTNGRQ